jgi:hypothetical protein
LTDLATKFEKQSSHRRGRVLLIVVSATCGNFLLLLALLEQEKVLSDVMADHANKMQGEMATLLLGIIHRVEWFHAELNLFLHSKLA